MFGMFAPAKTPAAIISQLNASIVQILNRADVKEKFINVGAEAVGSTSDEFARIIRSDMARTAVLIKDAGIHR